MVTRLGGYASYHAHFDKAYLISLENLKLGQVDMQKKWELYKYLKENYTHDDLVERISRGVESMINFGVTHCRTMVDADSTVSMSSAPVRSNSHNTELMPCLHRRRREPVAPRLRTRSNSACERPSPFM